MLCASYEDLCEEAYDSFGEEECLKATPAPDEHKTSGGMFGWMSGMLGGGARGASEAAPVSLERKSSKKKMAARPRRSRAAGFAEAAMAPAMAPAAPAARSASTYVCSEEAVISEA